MYSCVLLFLNIGGPEMILIIFVALLLFGGEKLPEIARGLGKGIRDFKDASEGVKREITNQINNYEERKPEPPAAPVEEPKAELPAATEEHSASAESEAISHENSTTSPTSEPQGVPNTIPYNENYGKASEESHVTEAHSETANTETHTEPVKTTHE
ncbi:MAG: twin-arginine translocase TatA/TatE family subunit [Mucilaginibacter sp.]|nr:twin-arginine translocase TatA/TatE family subunit [Mucilaginibacter sp.]